jgi:hypothetical protein
MGEDLEDEDKEDVDADDGGDVVHPLLSHLRTLSWRKTL